MAGTGPSAATAQASIDLPAVPEEPSLDRLKTEHAEYLRLYRKARLLQRENGFCDMQRLGAVRLAPARDVHGRPVFVFTPSKLPAGADLDLVVMYGILLMHDLVFRKDKQYSCVWVCNNAETSQLGFLWFRRQYHMVPHEYKKNMRAVALVHPSVTVRLLLLLLSYICKTTFWDKLVYADRIEFLDELVGEDPKAKLQLPKELVEYDRFLDFEAKHTAQAMAKQSGSGGGAGMFAGVGLDTHDYGELLKDFEQTRQREREEEVKRKEGFYDRALNRDEEEVESEDEDEEEGEESSK